MCSDAQMFVVGMTAASVALSVFAGVEVSPATARLRAEFAEEFVNRVPTRERLQFAPSLLQNNVDQHDESDASHTPATADSPLSAPADKSCRRGTWPYFDRECLWAKAQKRRHARVFSKPRRRYVVIWPHASRAR
jgi:hypothetical protein